MTKRCAMAALAGMCLLAVSSCTRKGEADPASEAPPQAKVTEVGNSNVVKVDNPERFAVVTTGEMEDVPQINVTGVVNPDVDLSVPVVTLASGRVVEIDAKLGDDVRKGQLLLKILSNDIAGGFQTLDQARADLALADRQLDRAKLLYDHGAISLNDLQVAEDAEIKAKVAFQTAEQQLRTMGADVDHPTSIISVYAPVSGTIVEQNVVKDANVHSPDNQPNLFTIANLSRVWVICNVYENDLPGVHVGDRADIQLDAYPDRPLHGRVGNIGKVLDADTRTAPVRVELANPGEMRSGMFVRATIFAMHGRKFASVPASAALHLHDRDWVFLPVGQGAFERRQVIAGKTVGNQQLIVSGLSPGQRVVANALALSAETE